MGSYIIARLFFLWILTLKSKSKYLITFKMPSVIITSILQLIEMCSLQLPAIKFNSPNLVSYILEGKRSSMRIIV